MNRFLPLCLMASFFVSYACPGAQTNTAQARLFSLSLQCQRAHGTDTSGFDWVLDMTTLQLGGFNGELSPNFISGATSHSSFIYLSEDFLEIFFEGDIELDIPTPTDANGNGFADFFEVDQPVAGSGSGFYMLYGFISGAVQDVFWFREAGSPYGTIFYSLPDPFFPGGTIDFMQSFQVLEYTGPLTYTPGSNTVNGTVLLSNTNTLDTLTGPVQFIKSSTNRFNVLSLQAGAWTNGAMQQVEFLSSAFLRDTEWPTNYYNESWFEFEDGLPATAEPDYLYWIMSIDDTNDVDDDVIPDFSDDPEIPAPPRQPVLSLALGTTNLLLTISGDTGRTNHIQQITSLISTNWQTVMQLVLTNDPQTVSLPLPAESPVFWRVLIPPP